MGVARLLAKGWALVCLFAGAHAIYAAINAGADPLAVLPAMVVSLILFAAMGFLFIGGFGASVGHSLGMFRSLTWRDFVPGFNDTVFLAFVCLSFANQILVAPAHLSGIVASSLEGAITFAVPGQRALMAALTPCVMDGGRVFASAFTWLLAIVFLGSALSHLWLAAGLVRLDRAKYPQGFGPATLAVVLGVAAVIGLQLLFIGTGIGFLPCRAFAGVPGAILIGLAPLLLAYLIFAALAALLAVGQKT